MKREQSWRTLSQNVCLRTFAWILQAFLLPSVRPVLDGIFFPCFSVGIGLTLWLWIMGRKLSDLRINSRHNYLEVVASHVFRKYSKCSILLGVVNMYRKHSIFDQRSRRFWWLKSRCTTVKVLAAPDISKVDIRPPPFIKYPPFIKSSPSISYLRVTAYI